MTNPEQSVSAVDDSFCVDCQKTLSEHDLCARSDVRPGGCGHYTCDCICDFIRDVWPTHPMNPDRRS